MFTGIVETSVQVLSNHITRSASQNAQCSQLVIKAPSNVSSHTIMNRCPPLPYKTKAFARSSLPIKNRSQRFLLTMPRLFHNIQPQEEMVTDQLGDSIAVNGCCLTIAHMEKNQWTFDVSKETLEITTLGSLRVGDWVNIERSMLAHTRLGGHFVSGHVDCRGTVHEVKEAQEGWIITIDIPKPFSRFCIAKGSVTVNGVSLTINQLTDDLHFSRVGLCLIPTTLNITNLKYLKPQSSVNIEVDHVLKHLERLQKFT